MQPDRAKILTASALFLVSGLIIYLTFRAGSPSFDPHPHELLATTMAQEASKLLGNGGRVVLFARDPSFQKNPAAQTQLKVLTRALKESNHPVALTNLLALDAARIIKVPPGDFAEILHRLSDQDVVISLMGPPELNEIQLARLGEKRPKVIALCPGSMPRQVDLKALFDNHLLTVAVIGREESRGGGGAKSGGFDKYFALITPQNLQDLPSPTR